MSHLALLVPMKDSLFFTSDTTELSFFIINEETKEKHRLCYYISNK